jgi:predicted RNase H-like nuclease (RuvC/YqgF family)
MSTSLETAKSKPLVLRTPPNPPIIVTASCNDTAKRMRPDDDSPKYTDVRDFSTLKTKVALLESSLKSKDATIAELLSKIEALTGRIETLESDLALEKVKIGKVEKEQNHITRRSSQIGSPLLKMLKQELKRSQWNVLCNKKK